MLVLIHGTGFGASCWNPMLAHLEDPPYAIDLPGRGLHPGDISNMTGDDFADSAASDIEDADLNDVTLVGHSAAGQTLPRVAARVPDRVCRLVYVSCVVPRHGQSGAEALDLENVSDHFDSSDNQPGVTQLPEDLAKTFFCNDMDDEQTALTMRLMVPDNPRLSREPMDLTGLQHGTPQTWIKLTRDIIIPPLKQDEFMTNLGPAGSVNVIEVEAGHMAMISAPRELARALSSVLSNSVLSNS